MLSDQEFENVYAWKPYRHDWPVDKNTDQTILAHFGALIKDMINNHVFECTQTQTGEVTNYLEFLCYPSDVQDDNTDQPGIVVCVSLCAPVAAFCETLFKKDKRSFVYAFPDASVVGIVHTPGLKPIEEELLTILKKHHLDIISNEYARKLLPETMIENLDSLNFGNTMLHGLFQWKE
jgi:hypothetical protein